MIILYGVCAISLAGMGLILCDLIYTDSNNTRTYNHKPVDQNYTISKQQILNNDYEEATVLLED